MWLAFPVVVRMALVVDSRMPSWLGKLVNTTPISLLSLWFALDPMVLETNNITREGTTMSELVVYLRGKKAMNYEPLQQ